MNYFMSYNHIKKASNEIRIFLENLLFNVLFNSDRECFQCFLDVFECFV